MPAKRKVTKSVFDCIKLLLKGGASNKEAAEYMDIHQETVRRIKNAETFEDYMQQLAEMRAMYYKKDREKKAKEQAKAEPAVAKAEPVMVKPVPSQPIVLPQHKPINGEDSFQIVRLMKEQLEILTILSNKVAFIVDELTK